MTPDFKITIDGRPLNLRIQDRMVDLSVSDVAGIKSDTVKIKLDDRDNKIEEPSDGALIRVWMGYKGLPLIFMGEFVLDGLDFDLAPDTISIFGKAVDFGGSIRDQKSKSWDGKTIKEIVETIAADNNLTPKVAAVYENIVFNYLAQNSESDINFLTRISKEIGAIATVKDQFLLLVPRGVGQSASGKPLPQNWIYKSQLLRGSRISKDKATIYKSVIAYWYDQENGERKLVQLGNEKPTYTFTHPFENEDQAANGVKSKMNEQSRARHTASFKVVGNPLYKAEGELIAIGLRKGLPTRWSIDRVDHQINSGGYTCSIECSLPVMFG